MTSRKLRNPVYVDGKIVVSKEAKLLCAIVDSWFHGNRTAAARWFGVNKTTLWEWMAGQRPVSKPQLARMADLKRMQGLRRNKERLEYAAREGAIIEALADF